LEAARHKSKREVESQVAALRPLPDVPSSVRKLPTTFSTAAPATSPAPSSTPTPADVADLRRSPAAGGNELSPAVVELRPSAPISRPAVVAPLSPERYKVQVTISRDTHDKLRRVQDLLRHSIPDGDPAAIFDRAISLLLIDLERKKVAHTSRPRPASEPSPGSRHVPAAVRREVWRRDGGQCAFVGSSGQCTERGHLEFHHVIPFADGGPTTSGNLQLRCRAHNAYEAEERFGSMLFRESGPIYGLGPDRVGVRN
jgi:5-methylcytosine-specific restriction endonuclease McrA